MAAIADTNRRKSILMTRALDGEGRVVSIGDVVSGRLCGCACVSCGTALIAKKGQHKAHHFAHDMDCNCNWSGETELHLLAKEVLEEDKEVSFTHLTLDGTEYKVRVPFVTVEQEVQQGHLRPDIMATTSEGETVLVEVAVTHLCDEAKIQHYRKNCVNALEIVLPPTLLDDIEVIDIDFVRNAISAARVNCISLNPLAQFCKHLADHNQRVIAAQGDTLREIRQEMRGLRVQCSELLIRRDELQSAVQDWSVIKSDLDKRAERYKSRLKQAIDSQEHVKKYELEKKKHKGLIDQLDKDSRLGKASVEKKIEAYRVELKKEAESHILHSEVSRLSAEVERLKAIKLFLDADTRLLSVEQHLQKIDARYENSFRELENNWLVIERLKPEIEKPEFINPTNKRLPDLLEGNKYKRIRG
ncbi:competence protein CoiA family protein [Vibrio breoganii]